MKHTCAHAAETSRQLIDEGSTPHCKHTFTDGEWWKGVSISFAHTPRCHKPRRREQAAKALKRSETVDDDELALAFDVSPLKAPGRLSAKASCTAFSSYKSS
ncbi:hypothetical protein V9T40_006561 [Parthenolecanium corni]|uniref:Uncharacterized protein n=1 Tax=Parthenolecanium corni TaxID=536013 RepID=A0AAN9Y7S0_9HEMI